MPKTEKLHPCQTCGACCARFRVAFFWREAEKGFTTHTVPSGLFEESDDFHRTMKGTAEKNPRRCVALEGRVGDFVNCTIYENRPSPCRDFTASYEDGKKNPRCDEAREGIGLKPLRREEWK